MMTDVFDGDGRGRVVEFDAFGSQLLVIVQAALVEALVDALVEALVEALVQAPVEALVEALVEVVAPPT